MSDKVIQEKYAVVTGNVLIETCQSRSDAERIAALLLRWAGQNLLEVKTAEAFERAKAKRIEEVEAARNKRRKVAAW
jgi:hypothetical protein